MQGGWVFRQAHYYALPSGDAGSHPHPDLPPQMGKGLKGQDEMLKVLG